MEGLTANAFKGIRGYWKRKGYERLNGPSRKQRKSRVELAQMGPASSGSGSGSNSNPRRGRRLWRWRIKLSPKIRIRSPKKWLMKLRDAYVKMMLNFANSAAFSTGGFGPFGAVDYRSPFGRPAIKEYDEKMIVEIYKSLVMAQGQIVPCEAGKISSQAIGSR